LAALAVAVGLVPGDLLSDLLPISSPPRVLALELAFAPAFACLLAERHAPLPEVQGDRERR
jgi:hypothetical protein